MFYLTFCILLCFSSNGYTQSVPYDCRNNSIVPMEDFRLEGYVGNWYIQERTLNPLEAGVMCTYGKVYSKDNGDIIMTTYRTNTTTGIEFVTSSKMKMVSPGKYALSITGRSGTVEIMILGTDYSNYVVEYVCTEFFGNLTEIIWITTRVPFPSEDVINLARSAVTAQGLPLRNMKKVDKSNCAIFA